MNRYIFTILEQQRKISLRFSFNFPQKKTIQNSFHFPKYHHDFLLITTKKKTISTKFFTFSKVYIVHLNDSNGLPCVLLTKKAQRFRSDIFSVWLANFTRNWFWGPQMPDRTADPWTMPIVYRLPFRKSDLIMLTVCVYVAVDFIQRVRFYWTGEIILNFVINIRIFLNRKFL